MDGTFKRCRRGTPGVKEILLYSAGGISQQNGSILQGEYRALKGIAAGRICGKKLRCRRICAAGAGCGDAVNFRSVGKAE